MSEFEKKTLQEVKGINKELRELNRSLKKDTSIKMDPEAIVYSTIKPTVENMVNGLI